MVRFFHLKKFYPELIFFFSEILCLFSYLLKKPNKLFFLVIDIIFDYLIIIHFLLQFYPKFLANFYYYLDIEEPEQIQESEKESAEGDFSIGIIEEDSIEITEVAEHSNEADGEEHSSQVEEEEIFQKINEIDEHSEGEENKNENENEKLTEENKAANYEIFDEILEDLNEIELPLRVVKMKIPVTIDDDRKVRNVFNHFNRFN